jgi:hypothetical protein
MSYSTSRNDHRICSAAAMRFVSPTGRKEQSPSMPLWHRGVAFFWGGLGGKAPEFVGGVGGLPNGSPLTNRPAKNISNHRFKRATAPEGY